MISKLLKSMGIPTSKASFLVSKVEVAHFLEGRIRIVYRDLKQDDDTYAKVVHELENLSEIDDFQINRHTGSVLIKYSPQNIKADSFLGELVDAIREKYIAQGAGK